MKKNTAPRPRPPSTLVALQLSAARGGAYTIKQKVTADGGDQ